MTASTAAETLVIHREFEASIQKVFDAWTSAEVLAMWFGPEDFEVLNAQIDLVVGGEYELTIKSPDDNVIRHFGKYVVITPPMNLTFTWELDDQDCSGSQRKKNSTLVSLSFEEIGCKTRLTLTHEKLPDKEAYDGHKFGWLSSFNTLEKYLIQ